MVLLLETADALDLRARRSTDPVQAAQLHQHAEERRQEAARLRSRLGALRRQSPARRPAFG
ncbi:hypothetical protein DQ241_17575 [Blastococcus sp. TF02A-30]|nr:hypothetical protein DQ241_17575 [Blastococcus sp. TF02A-30]